VPPQGFAVGNLQYLERELIVKHSTETQRRARGQKPGFSTKDPGFHAFIFARNPVYRLVQDLR
jgi:hypothetical protein